LNQPDAVRLGDLWQDLAGVLERDNRQDEAAECRQKAARFYQAVIERDARAGQQTPEAAFWKLQRLYQQASQYQKALALAEEQLDRWSGESLASSRLQAEQGILNIYLGSYKQAQTL